MVELILVALGEVLVSKDNTMPQNFLDGLQQFLRTSLVDPTPTRQFNVDFNAPAPDFTNLPRPEESQVSQWLGELYQPEMRMQNIFNELVGQFPERDEPSKWRKIAAAIYGMSREDPFKAAQGYAQAPFYSQLEDWEKRLEPVMKAADLERESNVNRRIMAEQTIQRRLQELRDAEARRKAEVSETQKQQDVDTRRMRAEVYAFRNMNPDYKIVAPRGGNMIAVNPRDPSKIIPLVDPETGKPIPSGLMSETDRMAMQLSNTLEVTRERTRAEVEEVIPARTAGQIEVAGEREKLRRETIRLRQESTQTLTPAAKQALLNHNYTKMLLEHPDWKGLVEIDNGQLVWTRRGQNTPDETKDAIRNYLSGGGNDPLNIRRGGG